MATSEVLKEGEAERLSEFMNELLLEPEMDDKYFF